MLNINHKNHGFTLIELLVTVAITLILLSGAIGYFLDYLERRNVSNSVNELKTFFQKAQSEAKSGNLGGCDQLNGYRVTSYNTGSNTEVSLIADCVSGTADPAEVFELPGGVSISSDLDYVFRVLHAGVDLPGGVASEAITIGNTNYNYSFTIYREGRFSNGEWL